MPGSSKEEQLTKTLLETQTLIMRSSITKEDINKILQRLDTAISTLSAASKNESPIRSADGLSDKEVQDLITVTPPTTVEGRKPEAINPGSSGKGGNPHNGRVPRQRVHQQRVPQQRVTRQRVQGKTITHADKEPTKANDFPMQTPAKVFEPDSEGAQPGENNPLQKRRQRKKHTTAFKRRPKESQFRVLPQLPSFYHQE
jgi:hypothetical protein